MGGFLRKCPVSLGRTAVIRPFPMLSFAFRWFAALARTVISSSLFGVAFWVPGLGDPAHISVQQPTPAPGRLASWISGPKNPEVEQNYGATSLGETSCSFRGPTTPFTASTPAARPAPPWIMLGLLFPGGLMFLLLPFNNKWAASEKLTQMFDAGGLAADIDAHRVAQSLQQVRNVYKVYGRIHGIIQPSGAIQAPARAANLGSFGR